MLSHWLLLVAVLAPPLGQPNECAWGSLSFALVSPDGRRSVHVDTSASPNPGSVCCAVDVTLVREHGAEPRVMRHRAEGDDEPWLMELIDWSPDSRQLLIFEQEIVCESDYAPDRTVIFDDELGSLRVLDPSPIFESHETAEDCALQILPLGFLPDGRAVVASEQVSTMDSTCTASRGEDAIRWWAWDAAKDTITPLKADVKVRAWATRRRPR